MTLFRKWFGVPQTPPDLKRDDQQRADPAAVPVGFVVPHVPAALPELSPESLKQIEDAVSMYLLQHHFPFRVRVVQVQIEGVA